MEPSTESERPHVLYFVSEGYASEMFRSRCPRGWDFSALGPEPSDEEKTAKIAQAHFLVQSSVVPVEPHHLDAAKRLRLIARQGVGLDKLDLGDLAARGIRVSICPAGTTETVAEHAILLMMAVGRHLVELHRDVTEGGTWPKVAYRDRSYDLFQSSVGLVGFGRIGQAVAERLRAFGADITVYVRAGRIPELAAAHPELRFTSNLEEVFEGSDYLSLHVPLTDETKQMVGERLIALMPAHAIIVNTSRGGVIDEAALAEALRHGRIAGAGLDVLGHEPPAPDHPLLSAPNTVITPHAAAGTRDSLVRKADAIFADMAAVWDGREPAHRVA